MTKINDTGMPGLGGWTVLVGELISLTGTIIRTVTADRAWATLAELWAATGYSMLSPCRVRAKYGEVIFDWESGPHLLSLEVKDSSAWIYYKNNESGGWVGCGYVYNSGQPVPPSIVDKFHFFAPPASEGTNE